MADAFSGTINVIILAIRILGEELLVIVLADALRHLLCLEFLRRTVIPEVSGTLDRVVVSLLQLAIWTNDSGSAKPSTVHGHPLSIRETSTAQFLTLIQVSLPHLELHSLNLLRATLESLLLPIVGLGVLLPGLLGEGTLRLG